MNALHLFTCVVVCTTLSPILTAQNKVVSSPPGFETTGQLPENRTWGYYLGQYTNERFQAADGQFRISVLQISEISYRLDQRTYAANTTSAGVGRSWKTVMLSMAACDYDKISSTFSTNPQGTPTLVFSSSMTWTTQVGLPSTNPAPWGGNGIRFPFRSPWIHAGSSDFLMDYSFAGGTLANNAAWSSRTSKRYDLDGYYNASFALGASTEYPASPSGTSPANCTDSAITSTTDAARNDIQGIFLYNGDHKTRPNEVLLNWRSFHTAKSAAVIKAWGFAGIPAGVSIGAGCNKLYLNTALPHFLIGQTTATSGKSPFTTLSAKFQPVFGGQSIWFQCAWDDSVSKKFSLTMATERKIPKTIPPRGPRRQTLYTSDPSAATGTGPNANGASWAANPMYLITYK